MGENAEQLSDEELVEVVRKHDQEAYAELVRRYQERLLGYVRYLLGDHDKALDVVQEAFLKAFVNLKSFDAERKFSSWLYRIAHNEAINQAKKKHWQLSLDKEDWIAEKISDETDLEEQASDAELRQLARGLVDRLPLKYREPVVLHYFQDLGYEEISDVLHLPTSTVGTRLRRAKKILLTMYKEKGEKI